MHKRERPVILTCAAVRAILAGRKPVTRQPEERLKGVKPGDVLWVREAFQHAGNATSAGKTRALIRYYATPDQVIPRGEWPAYKVPPRRSWWDTGRSPWSAPNHMPKWACRLKLQVLSSRVERLHEITAAEVLREGISLRLVPTVDTDDDSQLRPQGERSAVAQYAAAWDGTHGKKWPWYSNPKVRRIEFRVAEIAAGGAR